jgi:DeoR/GlpR family transcriptional regulator of sugar metabolism
MTKPRSSSKGGKKENAMARPKRRVLERNCLSIIGIVSKRGFATDLDLQRELQEDPRNISTALRQLQGDYSRLVQVYERDEPGRTTLVVATPMFSRPNLNLRQRIQRDVRGKLKVARAALEVIKAREPLGPIWISTGSTAFVLAVELASAALPELAIVTNNLSICTILQDSYRLHLVGGLVHKQEMLIETADEKVRGFPDPDFSFLGIYEWSYEGGCLCGRGDVPFAKAACRSTQGTIVIMTDATEFKDPQSEPFLKFTELEKQGKQYRVICHTSGAPDDLKRRVRAEAEKFPDGTFLDV